MSVCLFVCLFVCSRATGLTIGLTTKFIEQKLLEICSSWFLVSSVFSKNGSLTGFGLPGPRAQSTNCQSRKNALNQNLIRIKKCLKFDFTYWDTISGRFGEYLTHFWKSIFFTHVRASRKISIFRNRLNIHRIVLKWLPSR